MNLSKLKQMVRSEKGVSLNIPVTHLVAPDVFETQDGQWGAVLKIKGIPYATATDEELNRYQSILHRAIIQLDFTFMVMETFHRRLESTTLSNSGFRQEFCKKLHNKYHQQGSKKLYVNDIYLTLLYKPNAKKTSKKSLLNRLIHTSNQLLDKTITNAREIARAKAIKELNQKLEHWITLLQPFGVTRLGEHKDGYNEVLEFLSLVPNGGRSIRLSNSSCYAPFATTMDQLPHANVQYPHGHVGQYLANHRLFFGDAIQFQGNTLDDRRFAAMLSIKNYNKETHNNDLDALLSLDCEYIRTQTFIPIGVDESLKLIHLAQNKKISSGDESLSQVAELDDLLDLVASSEVTLGTHHQTLMILSQNKEDLEHSIYKASQAYSQAYLAVVRETLAQPVSFFSQIPGNARFIARAVPISSENFAHFCSFHNTQSGYRSPCMLGEPITLVQTPENTPVFWNYHKPGHRSSPTSGHSLFIGSNGSGKTALASFIDSEMNRFEGHRTFFLDRNEGAKIYILACNGTYFSLNPEQSQEYTMNPLALDDTEENRSFCKRWMASLLLEEGESSLNSHITEIISEAVDYGFDHLSSKDRRISTVAAFLPIDFPRWPQLKRWLGEQGTRAKGQYAWAFDNVVDSMNFNADKTGFDLTYLMDHVPPHISTPFYMYLLHRIKLSLTGCITSIVIDEMWAVMKSGFWEQELEHYLPTIRKLYGHIVGMTQSPDSLIDSPINHVLLDNKATLVLFTNPNAKKEIYIDELKLSLAEFKLIESHPSDSRLLLYKQDNDSIFCKIDLSAIKDELPVLSGNVNSVRLMNTLRARLGRDAKDWLPVFLETMKCA